MPIDSSARKKVLFVASSAPRFDGDGTAPFILNMAQDLCDIGWNVDILAPHAPNLRKRETIGSVSIYRFQYIFPAFLQTLCYQGGVSGNLKRSKWRFLQIPFFVLAEAFALLRLLQKENYDIIHSHWLIPQGFIGQMIARWKRVPHIVSVHGTDIYSFRQKPVVRLKRSAIENSRIVIANSCATKAEILKTSDKTRIDIIPTGTTPLEEKAIHRLNRKDFCEDDCRLLVFLGRLSEEKGLKYLLEALPRILGTENVKLLVIGDGPERDGMEAYARTLGIDRSVIFTGAVPHKDIYNYLLLGDIFIGPSVTLENGTTEAQGNTFVEAMFAGLPVIASDVGGIPDAVIHEETGLLVPEKSPEAIVDAVRRVLNAPVFAKNLSEKGNKHAHECFSRYGTAQKLSAIYSDILGR